MPPPNLLRNYCQGVLSNTSPEFKPRSKWGLGSSNHFEVNLEVWAHHNWIKYILSEKSKELYTGTCNLYYIDPMDRYPMDISNSRQVSNILMHGESPLSELLLQIWPLLLWFLSLILYCNFLCCNLYLLSHVPSLCSSERRMIFSTLHLRATKTSDFILSASFAL